MGVAQLHVLNAFGQSLRAGAGVGLVQAGQFRFVVDGETVANGAVAAFHISLAVTPIKAAQMCSGQAVRQRASTICGGPSGHGGGQSNGAIRALGRQGCTGLSDVLTQGSPYPAHLLALLQALLGQGVVLLRKAPSAQSRQHHHGGQGLAHQPIGQTQTGLM